MVGQDKAPSSGTASGVGDALKNMVGKGPASGKGFHTCAALHYPSSVPKEAEDKGARKKKDTGVGAEQTPHLPHHNAGEGDKMPAVQDNASLPSKKGNIDDDKKKPVKAKVTNKHQGPGAEKRPTGTSSSPGSRAVDEESQTHSPSFSKDGPSATYTHVIGKPEPDSFQSNYQFSDTSGSGSQARSSTSNSSYNEAVTRNLPKNEAGIGSSNHMIRDSLRGQDEMMAKMDPNGTTQPQQQGRQNAAARGEATGQIGGLNQVSPSNQCLFGQSLLNVLAM